MLLYMVVWGTILYGQLLVDFVKWSNFMAPLRRALGIPSPWSDPAVW